MHLQRSREELGEQYNSLPAERKTTTATCTVPMIEVLVWYNQAAIMVLRRLHVLIAVGAPQK